MKNRKFGLASFCFFFFLNILHAQDVLNIKFGKISPADFQVTAPKYDSGANAVIIANIGKTTFEGNNKGFFSIVFTRFTRVKILNKNGFDVAKYMIYLLDNRNGTSEKVTDIRGITYNLEGGVIQQIKLDEKSVFDEEYSKYRKLKKVTMPSLREGSVFDLTYTVKSNFFSDPPTWSFQGGYPCLWSEYEVTIPSMFHYLLKTRGDDHYDIKTTKAVTQSYGIQRSGGVMETDDMINVSCTSFQSRWVKKNVPVLREQPYMSAVRNYESSIYFELEYFKQDEEHEKDIEMKTWDQESGYLMKSEDFGFELDKVNGWMDEDLKGVTAGASNSEEEIRRVFDYVRGNFLNTDNTGLYINTSLKDVYKKRAGSVAELNLLLVAMLRHRNIKADPAILSTRENGVVTKDVPLIYEYNYLICVVKTGSKTITLDASQPFNPFGKLPSYCYNWSARLINVDHPDLIELSPDSVFERKLTQVLIINDEKENLSGSFKTVYGDDGSYDIREEVKKTSNKDFFKKEQISYTDIKISNEQLDSLNKPDFPLTMRYDIDFKDLKDADIFYFTPIIGAGFNTNPFAAAERLYPVEIPYKMDYTYLLSMEIPKGFQVDELPKSARVRLNETQGIFEYLLQQNPENIQMRVHLKLNQATFGPDEYSTLRDFFAYVVKKEGEQIVFKKIK